MSVRCIYCDCRRAGAAEGWSCEACKASPGCPCVQPQVLHEYPGVCQRCGKASRLDPKIIETIDGPHRELRTTFERDGFDWSVRVMGAPIEGLKDDGVPHLVTTPGPLDRESWKRMVVAVDALFEAWSRRKP